MIIDSGLVTGSLQVTGNTVISGSIEVTQGITGSFKGNAETATSASFASTATTASYALTASYLEGYVSPFPFTGDAEITGSLTVTDSISSTQGFIGSLQGNADTATSASYAAQSSNATSASFAQTASNVDTLYQDVELHGNLTVYGTSSFNYVTSSQLDVQQSFISVNVFEPAERFGGIKVYDSGSSDATASLAWDSLHNHWIYQNASGSTYSGGMLLAGPRNTGSLGDEPNLARWMVARSDGGDHLENTQIFSSGSVTQVTGSLLVTSGITGSLFGTATSASFTNVAGLGGFIQGGNSFGAQATIGTNDNQSLALETNGSTRMFVSSSGNVGIGTTTPKAKTEFSSGLPTSIPTYTNKTNGIVVTDGGAIYGRLGVSNFSSTGAGYPTYLQAGDFDGALYYNLLLNPLGGNVGIGTTSPDPFKLAVNGVVGINGTLGNTLGSLYIDHAGVQSWKLGVTTANTSTLSIGNDVGGAFVNKIMNFTNAGNVGIGNTNPIRRLEVASDGSNWISGTFSGTGSTNKVVVGNLVTPTIGGHNSSLGAWTDFTIAGDNILFSPFGTEKMRLRSDGSLANNGVKTQYASGYSDISSTFYVDFVAYPSTPYKIMAALTHWIAVYGAYREMIEFNNAYTDLSYIDIVNHSSTAGGSWSISRPNSDTIRVTHTGGNYAAYGNWWIQVIGT